MDESNYGDCSFCGAKMVKNPHTGKVFCSDKCWNKKEKKQEDQVNEQELLVKVTNIEKRLNWLIGILECIYPEMLKEREKRTGDKDEF